MLNDMLDFMLGILGGFAQLLGEPPLIYIIGFMLLAICIKLFKELVGLSKN